jgi:hypothetical protein
MLFEGVEVRGQVNLKIKSVRRDLRKGQKSGVLSRTKIKIIKEMVTNCFLTNKKRRIDYMEGK